MHWFTAASNAPRGVLLLIILAFLGMALYLVRRALRSYTEGYEKARQEERQRNSPMNKLLTNPAALDRTITSFLEQDFIADRILSEVPGKYAGQTIKYAAAEPDATEKLTSAPDDTEIGTISYVPAKPLEEPMAGVYAFQPDGVHVHERERPARPVDYSALSAPALEHENGDVEPSEDLEYEPEDPDEVTAAFRELPDIEESDGPVTTEIPAVTQVSANHYNSLLAPDWLERQLAKGEEWLAANTARVAVSQ